MNEKTGKTWTLSCSNQDLGPCVSKRAQSLSSLSSSPPPPIPPPPSPPTHQKRRKEKQTHHLDGFQKAFKRILGVLPRQKQEPLVPNGFQGLHFLSAGRREMSESQREGGRRQ